MKKFLLLFSGMVFLVFTFTFTAFADDETVCYCGKDLGGGKYCHNVTRICGLWCDTHNGMLEDPPTPKLIPAAVTAEAWVQQNSSISKKSYEAVQVNETKLIGIANEVRSFNSISMIMKGVLNSSICWSACGVNKIPNLTTSMFLNASASMMKLTYCDFFNFSSYAQMPMKAMAQWRQNSMNTMMTSIANSMHERENGNMMYTYTQMLVNKEMTQGYSFNVINKMG